MGCLIYEMVYGQTAFHTKTNKIQDLKNIILGGQFNFPETATFSKEGKDIVRRLLSVTPENRLGYNNIEEILNHSWFEEINWKDLYDKKIKSELLINVL